MKRISILVLTSIFTVQVNSAIAFNNSNFKGSYAFRLVGTSSIVRANEPRTVATGVLQADGKGNVSGHGSFRSAGITCLGNVSGHYTVNNNGTGLLGSVISTSTPGCFPIVLDLGMVLYDQGNNFEVANIENDYLSGTLTRQHKTKFKLADFQGSYSLGLDGPSSVVRANEPETVGVGLLVLDGVGGVTGTGSLRSAGITCQGSFAGGYTVSSDGVGAISTDFSTSTPGCFNIVVDLGAALFNKGNGAEVANVENDYMAGSMNRQILK
jgi:hypothetical protein